MDLEQVSSKTGCTTNSICIEWQEKQDHSDSYIVKYRAKEKGDVFVVQRTSQCKIQIANLESGTLYEIKIYVEDASGDEALFFKTEVRTIPSIASKLLKNAVKICDEPTIYRFLPARSTQIAEEIYVHEFCIKEISPSIPTCQKLTGMAQCGLHVKKPEAFSDADNVQEKTLLLVGASGSGKSTLVNAIINYTTDVSFADKFRFSITDEKSTKSIKQQKEDIVCFKIRWQDGFRVGFNLNVIEVSGFGPGNNASIYKNLITLFQSIKYINAAFLVVPSFSRLTADQRSIFNNILSIFGKDINYVIPLITYDDGGEIKAFSSLKAANVPFVDHMRYSFNNSQLLSGIEHVHIWNSRQNTMHNLFGEPTVFVNYSVELTKEVLKSRTKLIMYLQEARTHKQQIERIENIIKKYGLNNGRHQHLPENRDMQKDADKICINCNSCKQTCIFDCSLATRFFWFFICFLENVWSFACCVCSRFPCCYRLCRCSCNRAYCCCIKCLHRCLGCKCSCSFIHHEKEYGRYTDDRGDTPRNAQDVQDLSRFEIENTDEKLEMIADKEKLLHEFAKAFENIAKCADCIKNSALFDELPPEIEELRQYRENL